MSKTLTVFTPAYNRAHTIGRTYESLCRQTSKDFEWLVVDDGSKDNTRELVEDWMTEGLIEIRYIYQDNQGMHGAHNTAYRNIHTELNTCIDSDDYMPDDAVERIISFWRKYGSDKYGGFIGLDAKEDGSIIGKPFPKDLKETTLRAYYECLGGTGDKKLIYRTDVICRYPEYPMFEGENYIGLSYKYNLAGKDYPMLVTNEVYVIVEYQDDGSSMNMWRQYWRNPQGFAFLRKEDMKDALTFKKKAIACIHYVSQSLRIGNRHFLSEAPLPWLTLVAIPFGVCLYLVNLYMVKKHG